MWSSRVIFILYYVYYFDVYSTAEGECGLISKHVHYRLVHGNCYNFLLLYSVISKSPGIHCRGIKNNNDVKYLAPGLLD